MYRETTNPAVATGDGVAMAHAGRTNSNMEFVQFHPTALHLKGRPGSFFPKRCAVRAQYCATAREAFMERYHEMRHLAPRDVVSRAIVAELPRTGSPHVWLDLTARGSTCIKDRFPRIFDTCLDSASISATNSARASRGALRDGKIDTDLEGRTSIPGFYAAGEVACTGVHGANRLASNSLLEGLIFAARACRAMRTHPEGIDAVGTDPMAVPNNERIEVRELAWKTAEFYEAERAWIGNLDTGEPAIATYRKPTLSAIELRNIFETASLIARSARWRQESRGAHYRTDFPEKREA